MRAGAETRRERDSEAQAEAAPSWRDLVCGPHGSTLALLCLAVWLHAGDSLVMATMLPAIVAEIGGEAVVGWSVALYEIGSIAAGAASGLSTLRYGLRRPMSLAALLFAAGCALSALGPNMATVLVGRLLQGLGGGGLIAMAFVGVSVSVPRAAVPRAMAAMSTFWGASAFLGPLLGGLFVAVANWRWGFAFFAVQALALSIWILRRPDHRPTPPQPARPRFPLRRVALLSLGVLLIAAAGVRFEPWRTGLLVLGGVFCLIGFLRLDARAGETRLLPRQPFDIRQSTGAGLLMILALCMATIAGAAFAPILLTAIHGAGALAVGYVVACSSIGWSVAAVLASGAPERDDRRRIAVGLALIALGVVGLALAAPAGPLWLVAVCFALEGAGFGTAWTFVLRRATRRAPPAEEARLSGAIPTVQRLGYALGAAVGGIVANAGGLPSMDAPAAASAVALWVFLASLPFLAIGLWAGAAFLREPGPIAPTARRGPPRRRRRFVELIGVLLRRVGFPLRRL